MIESLKQHAAAAAAAALPVFLLLFIIKQNASAAKTCFYPRATSTLARLLSQTAWVCVCGEKVTARQCWSNHLWGRDRDRDRDR